MSYNVGDQSEVSVVFTNNEGSPVDPSTVALKIKTPTGRVTTLFYGVDPIVRDGVGLYHYNVSLNAEGLWHVRWEATGTIEAASERGLHVQASQFY